ncbi:MAG TPA: YggS family pyridoxal phosphate-dependent enzyme [Gammaproteobacteria bacterium]|nr:YggS family pyridoxal phosphate-dependent enzyme [Gammaproteobacteria bacterium]
MQIEKNLSRIKQLITLYEKKYGRQLGSVRLLAVSKKQSIEKIKQAFQAGQSRFGESYVQEALVKIATLEGIEWHFIGSIQRNKIRKIAKYFSWVQSVDSIDSARQLNDQRPAHLPPLSICIQVNMHDDTTKSGIPIYEIESLANSCLNLPHLKLRGLMTIPKSQPDFERTRNNFYQLFLKFQELKNKGIPLDTLSMGMSEDFEAAIAAGSTMVRIGTAIFGER